MVDKIRRELLLRLSDLPVEEIHYSWWGPTTIPSTYDLWVIMRGGKRLNLQRKIDLYFESAHGTIPQVNQLNADIRRWWFMQPEATWCDDEQLTRTL